MMAKLAWYLNRLRAMNVAEMAWRVQQKTLQHHEAVRWGGQGVQVGERCFYGEAKKLSFNAQALGLHFNNPHRGTQKAIQLLGGYDYEAHKRAWSAGFQTDREWPGTWSYALDYKQRDDIGDARTNWELNRHFQFALLAKAGFVNGSSAERQELQLLFEDWNRQNPWLHGISWTSVMEVGIRCIQWCLALAFLRKQGEDASSVLSMSMERGIVNMAGYVARHRSRFSSANNHLLVEACALAHAGFAFGRGSWQRLAVRLLDEQLPRQFAEDGVNKEMSLHYQTFAMEAYALTMHLLKANGRVVPPHWKEALGKACEFVAHCMVAGGAVCEFGDNDEGKILDLQGGEAVDHYRYVLQLCSMVVGKRYEAFEQVGETIHWLFSDEEIEQCKRLPLFDSGKSRTFASGGYSLLRSNGGRLLVGIDHAPLGFGSLAAHGHADALSFQLFADGKALLIDPGTYIYHCSLPDRNAFRQSMNHNTVTINGSEQSEMLGAFLWGKKARTRLLSSTLQDDGEQSVEAETLGLSGIRHTRRFTLKGCTLTIEDRFERPCEWVATLMLDPHLDMLLTQGEAQCETLTITAPHGHMSLEQVCTSPAYGVKLPTHALRIRGKGTENKIVMHINA